MVVINNIDFKSSNSLVLTIQFGLVTILFLVYVKSIGKKENACPALLILASAPSYYVRLYLLLVPMSRMIYSGEWCKIAVLLSSTFFNCSSDTSAVELKFVQEEVSMWAWYNWSKSSTIQTEPMGTPICCKIIFYWAYDHYVTFYTDLFLTLEHIRVNMFNKCSYVPSWLLYTQLSCNQTRHRDGVIKKTLLEPCVDDAVTTSLYIALNTELQGIVNTLNNIDEAS